MDGPKCKICGERHYGLCGGRVLETSTSSALTAGATSFRSALDDVGLESGSSSNAPVVAAAVKGGSSTAPPKQRARRGTFDRTVYQRELMRKRRELDKRAVAEYGVDRTLDANAAALAWKNEAEEVRERYRRMVREMVD